MSMNDHYLENNPSYHLSRGWTCYFENQWDEATLHFKKVLGTEQLGLFFVSKAIIGLFKCEALGDCLEDVQCLLPQVRQIVAAPSHQSYYHSKLLEPCISIVQALVLEKQYKAAYSWSSLLKEAFEDPAPLFALGEVIGQVDSKMGYEVLKKSWEAKPLDKGLQKKVALALLEMRPHLSKESPFQQELESFLLSDFESFSWSFDESCRLATRTRSLEFKLRGPWYCAKNLSIKQSVRFVYRAIRPPKPQSFEEIPPYYLNPSYLYRKNSVQHLFEL